MKIGILLAVTLFIGAFLAAQQPAPRMSDEQLLRSRAEHLYQACENITEWQDRQIAKLTQEIENQKKRIAELETTNDVSKSN